MSDESNNTALVIAPANSLAESQAHRQQLYAFVQSELKEGIDKDYALIPGTPKKSLLKPGAEKLARFFGCGSRIVHREQTIDPEKGFAFFAYTVELYHLASGKTVSQCEGSANSYEKKFKHRPMADMLNTLQKMAQKRAFVGSVVMGVGASEFFTQDIEDMDIAAESRDVSQASNNVTNLNAKLGLIKKEDAPDPSEYVIPPWSKTMGGKKLKDVPREHLSQALKKVEPMLASSELREDLREELKRFVSNVTLHLNKAS